MLIGLSGYARSGKDTVGQILVEDYGFQRLAFADALKAVAYDCHPAARRLVDLGGWEYAKTSDIVRHFLQDLGVAVRNHIGPDVWVQAALSNRASDVDYVITDARFPNEAEAIRADGGFLVRIDRPGTGPVNGHVSETALDDVGFDFIIPNASDLYQLRCWVRAMYATFKAMAADA